MPGRKRVGRGIWLGIALASLTLVISPAARAGLLDIGDSTIVIRNPTVGQYDDLQVAAQAGYGTGLFDGTTGITSSAAALEAKNGYGLLAVAVVDNSQLGLTSIDGIQLTGTEIILTTTYLGDATLDGVVDGFDFQAWAYGVNNHLTGWVNGDFDYSNTPADGFDFQAWAYAYNLRQQGYTMSPGMTAVPEPATLVLLGAGLVALLRRRKGR